MLIGCSDLVAEPQHGAPERLDLPLSGLGHSEKWGAQVSDLD